MYLLRFFVESSRGSELLDSEEKVAQDDGYILGARACWDEILVDDKLG